MQLLHKIEELTLHLIAQNQEMQRIKTESDARRRSGDAEIERLRRGNRELESRLAAVEEQLRRWEKR